MSSLNQSMQAKAKLEAQRVPQKAQKNESSRVIQIKKSEPVVSAQRTIANIVTFSGTGLHTGHVIHVKLEPAQANSGISFVRVDLDGHPEIEANYQNVVTTQMATTLGQGNIKVGTVEHLMAALAGAGVDNVRVLIDGPEVPIMDGSSSVFYQKILEAGTVEQDYTRPYLKIRKKVEVRLGEKWAALEPSDGLEVVATIEWDHPSIGFQELRYRHKEGSFDDLCSARTFGFLKDVEKLKAQGLIKGATLDSAVVLDDLSIVNPEGLRFSDEFVRHKVLDAIGDFKLAGLDIKGVIRLHRSGHDLHRLILERIFTDSSTYDLVRPEPILRESAVKTTKVSLSLAGKFAANF